MKSKAFTLIELIIVIVLLGILAATALPRFVDFSDDAERAKFRTIMGAFKTSIDLYHLKWRQNPVVGVMQLQPGVASYTVPRTLGLTTTIAANNPVCVNQYGYIERRGSCSDASHYDGQPKDGGDCLEVWLALTGNDPLLTWRKAIHAPGYGCAPDQENCIAEAFTQTEPATNNTCFYRWGGGTGSYGFSYNMSNGAVAEVSF